MQLTKSNFTAKANPILVQIAGQQLVANPKGFSTGSVGFYLSGKITITLGGTPVQLQVSCNLTAIGSKDWQS
jgi:hypothetical protein